MRCAVVVYDPALAASQPLAELAASALNALGHAVEAPCTVRREPGRDAGGARGGAAAASARSTAREPDRDALALGALLAGYALDSTRLRAAPRDGADARAARARPATGRRTRCCCRTRSAALARRFAAAARGARRRRWARTPAAAAARLCALTGATRLRELGVEASALDACAETAPARPRARATRRRARGRRLRALYAAAW